MKRNRWRLTYQGVDDEDLFRSQAGAYRFIHQLAEAYAKNPEGMSRYVTVWVDERDERGWRLFEGIDLTEVGS